MKYKLTKKTLFSKNLILKPICYIFINNKEIKPENGK